MQFSSYAAELGHNEYSVCCMWKLYKAQQKVMGESVLCRYGSHQKDILTMNFCSPDMFYKGNGTNNWRVVSPVFKEFLKCDSLSKD